MLSRGLDDLDLATNINERLVPMDEADDPYLGVPFAESFSR
jgi:hypothetical protein